MENIDFTVYKNGTQLARISLPISGVNPTYLLLKKQRFICQACQYSFTAKTPIVQMNCFISHNVKAQIVVKSAEAQSLTSIARDCSVSPTTVQREINQVAKQFTKGKESVHLERKTPGYKETYFLKKDRPKISFTDFQAALQ